MSNITKIISTIIIGSSLLAANLSFAAASSSSSSSSSSRSSTTAPLTAQEQAQIQTIQMMFVQLRAVGDVAYTAAYNAAYAAHIAASNAASNAAHEAARDAAYDAVNSAIAASGETDPVRIGRLAAREVWKATAYFFSYEPLVKATLHQSNILSNLRLFTSKTGAVATFQGALVKLKSYREHEKSSLLLPEVVEFLDAAILAIEIEINLLENPTLISTRLRAVPALEHFPPGLLPLIASYHAVPSISDLLRDMHASLTTPVARAGHTGGCAE